MGDALVAEELRYRYRRGRRWALDGLCFSVEPGTVLGLVGPNGSAKTTLYRLILGFMRPAAGRVRIAGSAPALYRRRHGIGYLPEQVRLPPNLRVSEFATLVARLAGLRGSELSAQVERLLLTLALQRRMREPIGALSHGYRQRVGLLAALLGEPRLLLLDEPANGLDPASVGVLRVVLRSLRRRGCIVIVSSHNLVELERVCDRVLMIRQGRKLGDISRAELVGEPPIWVACWDAEGGRGAPVSLDRAFRQGGVRLAADEMAFRDEWACRRFAAAMGAAGVTVGIEGRPYDLEYLFHALVQRRCVEPGNR